MNAAKRSELEKAALTQSIIEGTESGRAAIIEVGRYKHSPIRVRSIIKKLGYHFIKTDAGYSVTRHNVYA